jgi:uncharacterized cupin superfamily protein
MSSDGYAIGSLDQMGEGPGMRKIRRELDVKHLGVNALVLPAGFTVPPHAHERQEELYFVHRGTLELRFPGGESHRLEEGGMARVDAATPRQLHNPGDTEVVVLAVGAEGGYVGRDGVKVDEL